MPRPISISSGPSTKPAPSAPGTVTPLSPTPIVPNPSATKAGELGHLGERPTVGRSRPGDFVHQYGAGQTASPGVGVGLGDRDVVAHHDHLHVETVGAGDLGRKAEVEPVAGVALHDQ